MQNSKGMKSPIMIDGPLECFVEVQSCMNDMTVKFDLERMRRNLMVESYKFC
jgi:hypothetical protein